MSQITKHIALLFITLLIASLLIETGVAMHALTELSDTNTSSTNATGPRGYCAAGFLISNKSLSTQSEDVERGDTKSVEEETHKQFQTDRDNNTQKDTRMISINCHSSLQLLSTSRYIPLLYGKPLIYDPFIPLISPQAYIFEIADPPRHG